MEIRFLGVHNLESVDTKLVSLLIDGVLAVDAGSITTTLSFEEQQRIKSFLITHHHFDHIRDLAHIRPCQSGLEHQEYILDSIRSRCHNR